MSEGPLPVPSEPDAPALDELFAEPGESRVTRRRFLRFLMSFSIVSSFAMVITPIAGFIIPSKSSSSSGGGKVLVSTTEKLPVGSGAVVAVGSKPAVILNTDGGVKAFSAICTHLGCIVAWDESAKLIICPCHDGRFNPTTGAVVSGPPPAPLPALTATIEGKDIFIMPG